MSRCTMRLACAWATAPHTLPSYVAMARATLTRAVADGRLLPIRAAKISGLLDAAESVTATGRAAGDRAHLQ